MKHEIGPGDVFKSVSQGGRWKVREVLETDEGAKAVLEDMDGATNLTIIRTLVTLRSIAWIRLEDMKVAS